VGEESRLSDDTAAARREPVGEKGPAEVPPRAPARVFTAGYVAYLVAVAVVAGIVAWLTHERLRPLTLADMARPDYVDSPDRILRKIDRDGLLHDLRPSTHTMANGVRYETNADGQRDDVQHELAKTPGRNRVIFLGDSFTFGWGLELGYGFVKQLESLVAGARWEFINLGVPAYATVNEVALFEAKGLRYSPDLVILMYHPNDSQTFVDSPLGPGPKTLDLLVDYYDGNLAEGEKARVEAFLRDRGYPLDPAWNHRRINRMGRTYLVTSHLSIYWEVVQQALSRLERMSHEHGFEVLVGIIPAIDEIGPDYPYDDLHAQVSAEMRAHGFGVLDLKPVLSRYPRQELMLWGHDGHTNAFANRIIAQVLADRLTGGR
jgi:hypothetical protein